MAGILGIYMFDEKWKVARFGVYGLLALQHRGQETAGLTVLGKSFQSIKGKGLVDEVFPESKIKEITGHLCVAEVSPYVPEHNNIWPIHIGDEREIAMVLDGKINAIDGKRVNQENYDSSLKKILSEKLRKIKDPIEFAKFIITNCEGGFAFILLSKDGVMVAGRDPKGVKPLSLGKIGFEGGVVASETCVMDVIGERTPLSPAENIEPGELRIFTNLSANSICVAKCDKREYCSFEYVYLARPDSYINDIPIYKVRKRIGELLAEEKPLDADVVIGVPETAIPFAMAYSNKTGIPMEKGFEQTGRRVRSAIKPTQLERLIGVQLKLNVISEAIRGKRVILIDDSVVRGNTLSNIVYLMKEKGAREVHVLIGSPAIVSGCPYGVEVPPKDELIGRHLSEEKIAEVIGADSFHYLTIENFLEAIGLKEDELCLRCFGLTGGDDEL